MTIGQLSNQTGISIETIRYYESIGLLPVPKKRESGYRDYTRDYISLLEFVKRAKELDFTLSEIKELSASENCNNFCDLTSVKLEEVKKKIEYYKEMEKKLSKLLNSCTKGDEDCDDGCNDKCEVITSLGAPQKTFTKGKELNNA